MMSGFVPFYDGCSVNGYQTVLQVKCPDGFMSDHEFVLVKFNRLPNGNLISFIMEHMFRLGLHRVLVFRPYTEYA